MIGVAALQKPCHTTCIHQTGRGCAIYNERPAECKTYKCVWLQGHLPEEMRPDKIGLIVDSEGGDEWVVIQECREGSLATPVGRRLLARLAQMATALRCGVRIEPYNSHVDAEKRGDVKESYVEIAPKVWIHEEGMERAASRTTGQKVGTRRNDLCPCGSGKKNKHCCNVR